MRRDNEPGGQDAQPARDELLALLAATRPDWDPTATSRALWDVAHAGAPWATALWCAVRAAVDPHARPQSIRRLYEQRRPEHDHPRPETPNEAYRRARRSITRPADPAARQEAPRAEDPDA